MSLRDLRKPLITSSEDAEKVLRRKDIPGSRIRGNTSL
jgi:hypothetical protein